VFYTDKHRQTSGYMERLQQATYRDANVPIHCAKDYNTAQFIKIKLTTCVRPTLLKRTKTCHIITVQTDQLILHGVVTNRLKMTLFWDMMPSGVVDGYKMQLVTFQITTVLTPTTLRTSNITQV
jgi:hypothetical protein